MDHHPFPTTQPTTNTPSRAEAERLLGVALKLLHSHDLSGSREFALLAQETDPLLEGSDQILAITDVLLASEKRVNNNRHHDWYSILQTDRRSDPDLLRKNYRRLALLLHPDKNNYPLADGAFKLVADAWGVLSDPTKRTPYDHELSLFSKVDLRHTPVDKDKLPVRRSARGGAGDAPLNDATPPPHAGSGSGMMNQGVHQSRSGAGVGGGGTGTGSNFWTACPYCYVLYEYPRVYKEYCIRCQNCDRAFHAAALPSMPPMVPGKEAYYCCWGFFPIGFSAESGGKGKKVVDANNVPNNNANNVNAGGGGVSNNNENQNNNENPNMGFPNWMPGMFTTPVPDGGQTPQQHHGGNANANANANVNMNNTPNVNVNMNAGGATVVDFSTGSASAGFGNAVPGMSTPGAKKRGRPRKNPM